MQDRYTGDVGDFGKYGLLRWLCGLRDEADGRLRLGLIWYRTDDRIAAGDPVGDGKHIGYLRPDQRHRFRPCDPPLYDSMRDLIAHGERRVRSVERLNLFGGDALFHDSYVPAPPADARGTARTVSRRRWLGEAKRTTHGADLLFLDPDNGLAPRSRPISHRLAPKYVYLDELDQLAGDGRTVVIYHHLGRNGSHDEQIASWSERLRERCAPADLFALRFGRGTARAYFVLAAGPHATLLRRRTNALLASPWREHFTLA